MKIIKSLLFTAFLIASFLNAAAAYETPESEGWIEQAELFHSASLSSKVSGNGFITAKMQEWSRDFSRLKIPMYWHDYNKMYVEKLFEFLGKMLGVQGEILFVQDYTNATENNALQPYISLMKKEVIQAGIEELAFIARSELCSQRSDDGPENGVKILVDYSISRTAYIRLDQILSILKCLEYRTLQQEADQNITLIQMYSGDRKPRGALLRARAKQWPLYSGDRKPRGDLLQAGAKLWPLLRDQVANRVRP